MSPRSFLCDASVDVVVRSDGAPATPQGYSWCLLLKACAALVVTPTALLLTALWGSLNEVCDLKQWFALWGQALMIGAAALCCSAVHLSREQLDDRSWFVNTRMFLLTSVQATVQMWFCALGRILVPLNGDCMPPVVRRHTEMALWFGTGASLVFSTVYWLYWRRVLRAAPSNRLFDCSEHDDSHTEAT